MESAGRTQLTGDEAASGLQRLQYGTLYGITPGTRHFRAAIVAEVLPPDPTDEAFLLVEELTVHARNIIYDASFPLPKRHVPSSIGELHIITILVHDSVSRKSVDAAVKQGQEPNLSDELHQSRC